MNAEPRDIAKQIMNKNMPKEIAILCKSPILGTYLEKIRNTGPYDEPDYEGLMNLLRLGAPDCEKKLDWTIIATDDEITDTTGAERLGKAGGQIQGRA